MRRIALPTLVLLLLLSMAESVRAQVQIGSDIDGEAAGDQSGRSVSMPDAQTIAIGAPYNSESDSGAGHVRVYSWNGNSWQQKGLDIDGEAAHDISGWIVSMGDANTVAIGSPENQGVGFWAGQVRVFSWNGSAWVQKGADIDPAYAYSQSGYSVSMPDANTVAVGAWQGSVGFFESGEVRVYRWDGNAWVQKGQALGGSGTEVYAGLSVSMPDSNTIAFGSLNGRPAIGVNAGDVLVYGWNGSTWVQRGQALYGDANGDEFGASVSMPDANTLAVGAPLSAITGPFSGLVRVFSWDGTQWTQQGNDLYGTFGSATFGQSVSMPDNITVAVGAPGDSSGSTRVYRWMSNSWTQIGTTIYGEDAGDWAGWSVSMGDAQTIGIGSMMNNDLDSMAGSTRVFGGLPVAVEQGKTARISAHPNPTTGRLRLHFSSIDQLPATISVRNGQGGLIQIMTTECLSSCMIDLDVPSGIYFAEVHFPDGIRETIRIVKQ
ncbi:MAG: hypothetical protein U0176_10280 [Bacteroidia bacterium]